MYLVLCGEVDDGVLRIRFAFLRRLRGHEARRVQTLGLATADCVGKKLLVEARLACAGQADGDYHEAFAVHDSCAAVAIKAARGDQ